MQNYFFRCFMLKKLLTLGALSVFTLNAAVCDYDKYQIAAGACKNIAFHLRDYLGEVDEGYISLVIDYLHQNDISSVFFADAWKYFNPHLDLKRNTPYLDRLDSIIKQVYRSLKTFVEEESFEEDYMGEEEGSLAGERWLEEEVSFEEDQTVEEEQKLKDESLAEDKN